MKLHELAYFTDNVQEMTDFYRSLLSTEPVAQSEDMAIFMSGRTKIFIHRNYPPSDGDIPPNNHIAFAVEDVDAACETLTKQGLTLRSRQRIIIGDDQRIYATPMEIRLK